MIQWKQIETEIPDDGQLVVVHQPPELGGSDEFRTFVARFNEDEWVWERFGATGKNREEVSDDDNWSEMNLPSEACSCRQFLFAA